MGINFGALGKALLFTASPISWAAARGAELVTGKDDIVRNNPLTYYKDVFSRSEPAAKVPAGGVAKPAAPGADAGYQTLKSYQDAMKAIEGLPSY